MRSMNYDPRTYYHWWQVVDTSHPVRGSATAQWEHGARDIVLHFVPMPGSGRTKTEYGYSQTLVHKIFVDNYEGFKVGDRIGDDRTMMYEVTGCVTYRRSQQLEVRKICQKQ